MLGTRLQFDPSDDRFYSPSKPCRSHQLQRSKGKSVISENSGPGTRTESDEQPSTARAPCSNLDRFLEATMPSVPAQYLYETRMRGWRPCDVEFRPYFSLGDLWESFKEWSAFGAGVPLVMNGSDCVVQYYVPYLSGIQIYGALAAAETSLESSRQPSEDSDTECYRDSSSDGSSDCEIESDLKYSREQWNCHHLAREAACRMDRLSLREKHVHIQEGLSSDDGEIGNSQGHLLFEFLEHDPPFCREPLADKISDLSNHFPGLKTLRSFDLSPASWVSVAWYPIYRIPLGPTLRDLDSCFLTFHSLFTPMRGVSRVPGPVITYDNGIDNAPVISLPVFGLASYKFRGSTWTSEGGCEWQLASSLLQAADNWLRLLQVDHPDFQFFTSHGMCCR